MAKAQDNGSLDGPAINIRTTPRLAEVLQELAAADRRPLATYVRIALEDHARAKGKKL